MTCFGSAGLQIMKIWPGVAPGSEKWTQEERVEKNTPIGSVVFNVVIPTLTVYLPERAKATGTGIIIEYLDHHQRWAVGLWAAFTHWRGSGRRMECE